MLKYEVGPFKKPSGSLLSRPARRVTPKSDFLKQIEQRVANAQKIAAARWAREQDALDAHRGL